MGDDDTMDGPPGADAAAAQPPMTMAPAVKKPRSAFSKAMQSHGMAKGDGVHKRHPATSHYNMGKQGNKFGKR